MTCTSLSDHDDSKPEALSMAELRAKRLARLQGVVPDQAISEEKTKLGPFLQKKNVEVIVLDDSDGEEPSESKIILLNNPPNSSPPCNTNKLKRKGPLSHDDKSQPIKTRRISLSPPPPYAAVNPNSSDDDDDDDIICGFIPDGQTVQVTGSTGSTFILKNVGGVYSCSCPSWKYQKISIKIRTCKHLDQYLGKEAPPPPPQPAVATSSSFKLKRAPQVASRSPVAPSTSKPKDNPSTKPSNGVLFLSKDLMLAKKWEEDKYDCRDFLMSEKLDGWRALWDGTKLVTRSGAIIDAPDYFVQGLPCNMALDGELFHGRENFQIASSILKSSSSHPGWKHLKYVVFDSPSTKGTFEQRLQAVENFVAKVGSENVPFLQVHPHVECRGKDHLESELARIDSIGGEGLMLRQKKSSYQAGRTPVLMKVKTFTDDEAIVLGYKAGKGRHIGKMGAVQCRLRNGTKFHVGTGFSDAMRSDPPAIGSIFTFRYCDTTNKGVPRHAAFLRMRSDVDPSEFGA